MKSELLALVAGSALAASFSVSAVPTLLSSTVYNGHTYFLYQDAGVSWPTALFAADDDYPGGYLAALTTAAETTAVYNGLINTGFFSQNGGFGAQAWLGGFSSPSTQTDPTNFGWISGEAWTADNVANFGPGQPSGAHFGDITINRFGDSKFSDQDNIPTLAIGGYIVEVNAIIPDSGATVALLGLALAGLSAFSRRSK